MINEPTTADIESYGVLARVAMKIKLPNDNYKVKFKIISRIKVKEYFLVDPYFVVDYEEILSETETTGETETLIKMVMTEIANHHQEILIPNNTVMDKVTQGLPAEQVVDLVVFNLNINEQEKYRYLVETNLNKKLRMLLEDINKQKMIVDLERKINEEVKKSIDEKSKRILFKRKNACHPK